ncbi:hypothetical protein BJ138DRAFT_51605 [Hygrophoropsis aurantiaca]|uniref:Uncharacterized protein n=1 Tax=Hygrophoropsis aurantiaca TaxID=72124 RepID=A0ACB8ACN0_9AGAM|nr:hypothetical protein BJ138DRAFT_51605 [Hygrophoropsis aurantiaca]
MSTFETADARIALMSQYLSRHPLAVHKSKSIRPPRLLQPQDINAPQRASTMPCPTNPTPTKASHNSSAFTCRGRTIYSVQRRSGAYAGVTKASRQSIAVSKVVSTRDAKRCNPPVTHLSVLTELARFDAEEEAKRIRIIGHDFEFTAFDLEGEAWEESQVENGGGSPVVEDQCNLRFCTPPRKSTSPDSTPALSPSGSTDSESDVESIVTVWDIETIMDSEDCKAQEMFDMFIRADACIGSDEWF